MLIKYYIGLKKYFYEKWVHGVLPKKIRIFIENILFLYTWFFYKTFEKWNIKYYINDTKDYMERALFLWDQHDKIDFIINKIESDMVILDIGANIGDTCMKFAERVWKWGYIYWFEPDATSYQRALRNFSLNTFQNIELCNIWLWNTKTELFINNNSKNRWSNFISKNGTERVNIDTLDNWKEKQNIKKINIIKIDVEWYEYKVLLGWIKTIKKYKPDLFLELDSFYLKRNGDSCKKIIKLLKKLNYFCIDTENSSEFSVNQNLENMHTDVYATRKTK